MNYRRLIAMTAIAGVLAVTGCSANTPERNQGNRNGQRVADAVNRRPDSYNDGYGERDGARTSRFTRNTNRRANTFARPHSRMGNTFGRNTTNNQHTMNRTERGIPAANRATRRAANNAGREGISRASLETVPVFFNKTKTAPEQESPQTPEQAPVQ